MKRTSILLLLLLLAQLCVVPVLSSHAAATAGEGWSSTRSIHDARFMSPLLSSALNVVPPYNNVGTSDDSAPGSGNFDHFNNSYSAEALHSVGIDPGGTVFYNGIVFTWPTAVAATPNNYEASGQTIPMSPVSNANILGFLGASSNRDASGSATITYTDGTTQSFVLGFSDWALDGVNRSPSFGNKIVATMNYRNTPAGKQFIKMYVFYAEIALQAGKTIQSVTLPGTAAPGYLHVFAVATKSQSAGPPVLHVPGTITVNATSPQGAVVTYTVTATDPVYLPDELTIICTPPSGSTFPIGITNVTCSATNPGGDRSTASFQIVVNKGTPPTLQVPGTITVTATSPQGAVVIYSVMATSANFSPTQLTIACTPSSGSTFPIGTTTVICTASDPVGNSSTGSFQVIVNQGPPPTLQVPARIIVKATSRQGAVVNYMVSATSPAFPSTQLIITCTPLPGLFPIGTTTVICNVKDPAGNSSTASFQVVVTALSHPAHRCTGDRDDCRQHQDDYHRRNRTSRTNF